MAKISSASERIISIKTFLGLNENPDGDTNLKNGEAAVMSNFKITDDGSLQIRGGTREVAGLLQSGDYHITEDAEESILATDPQKASSTFTVYPYAELSSGGILTLTGDPTTLDFEHVENLKNCCYYKDSCGRIYKFIGCDFVSASGGTKVDGGSICIGTEELRFYSGHDTLIQPVPGVLFTASMLTVWSDVRVVNGQTAVSGNGRRGSMSDYVYFPNDVNCVGQYAQSNIGLPNAYKITTLKTTRKNYFDAYGYQVSCVENDVYRWRFKEVSVTTTITDTMVRGIWSGYVNGVEYLVAACSGHLWSLTVDNKGVWNKMAIGVINTTNPVFFFAFNNSLYMLNGSQYKVWNGSTLSNVLGYIPLVLVSTPPAGGGTPLQQANKLTGKKRQQFSPDGTSTVFKIADTNITAIDWVKHNGTLVTGYSFSLADGTVTVTTPKAMTDEEGGTYYVNAPPPAGTNTLEVQWSKGSGNKAAVLSMRYSEFFNGANDTRVFFYGNGTNKVIYSGIDENGQARADYFPDLNEAEIGAANTPVTGLTKHYDTLIAFKENSAYSITYGTLTFEDGTTNAGFYVLPLNKTIGNTALGQAMLVENNPRTLDGRSVYEWQGVNSMITNDQRNAMRISERIETTLKEIELSRASAYFDKINHEYYIMQGGVALVHNTENNSWYVYRDFPAACMIVYKDEVYLGTFDGYIRHFSRDYVNDNGTPITAYFESGSMDFGIGYKKKSSRELWISLKPEEYSGVNVTIQTDAQNSFEDAKLLSDYTIPASNGVFTSFFELDFSRFSFGTNNKPQTKRLKIRARDFSFYKLIFTSRPDFRATILGADIQASYLGNVR